MNAQLRLTIDGGIAVANFDQKPSMPQNIQTVLGIGEGQTERFDPLESSYIGVGMAHHPTYKPWGWSVRLQHMKRGYRYLIKDAGGFSSSGLGRAYSYSSFIDGMAQLTRTITGQLRISAGPYFSLAFKDYKFPSSNLSGQYYEPDTRTDYGINAGLSYPFGRLSITANYQQSFRRYSFAALDDAVSQAVGGPSVVVFGKTPRISSLRIGLEYAIWE